MIPAKMGTVWKILRATDLERRALLNLLFYNYV